jgi:hypothetical protein
MYRFLAILFTLLAGICAAYEIIRHWPKEHGRVFWVDLPIFLFLVFVLVRTVYGNRNSRKRD